MTSKQYTYLVRCKDVVYRVARLDQGNSETSYRRLSDELEQMNREWGVAGVSIWFKHQWQSTPMPYLGRILRRFAPFVRQQREPGVGLCHELIYDAKLWSECLVAGRLLRLYEANRHRVKLEWMEAGPLLWLSYDTVSETGNRFLDALLFKLTELDQCTHPHLPPPPRRHLLHRDDDLESDEADD